MKIIKLRGVHYLSFKGITLTMNQPIIEATEENLEKLAGYIKLGFVEVKEKDETDKTNEYKPTDLSREEKMFEATTDTIDVANALRYPSLDELKEMSKKEIMAFLDEKQISYKPTMKKEELIELVLA